jgi:hypothetical protein
MKIYNSTLLETSVASGSFRITGSSGITGSLNVTGGITGSLLGTSSFASTASFVPFAQNITGSMGVVVHGAVASTARPTVFSQVTWIGSVEPNNKITNDIWYDVV